MTEDDDLVGLYERWGALSDTEGTAIRESDWTQVAETQRAKESLQHQIMARTGVLAQSGGGFAAQEVQERVHSMLHKLIEQEKANQSALMEQRSKAETESEECKTSGNNLRQIHKAYSGARASNWHSYS